MNASRYHARNDLNVRQKEMSEFEIQKELIKWFRAEWSQYEKCIRLSMNGINLGKNAPRIINQMKSQGMVPDESDLFFAVPKGKQHGLFLELKAPGKKPTAGQQEYLDEMWVNDYWAEWVDNLEDAKQIVNDYMTQEHIK